MPLVAVEVTVANADHAPQFALSVLSLNWISYPLMGLPVPAAAPDHDKVAVVSVRVILTLNAVGAVQAVFVIAFWVTINLSGPELE